MQFLQTRRRRVGDQTIRELLLAIPAEAATASVLPS